ncbi:hypothetical protein [Arthrobacter sp. BE255]|uniref:hypothetical protein n=1 Tax=Arthrobacter sp. BE255 TaxID=2817721 RepID=UPI002866829A|nr:hypothetical protein [Arthrobacter sp. BE255]MDR7159870.1 hypothetical protein [Arthrobacter sp. BE255]
MKRRSSGSVLPPFAPSGTRSQTLLPQLPAPARSRADNPEAWDALMRELDADFA